MLSVVLSGFETPTSMFTLVVLIVTIVVCLSHVCFGHFKYLSAHNYKVQRLFIKGSKTHVRKLNVRCLTVCVAQIDTKENDMDAVENGRPARPSSSPTTKSQVSGSNFITPVLRFTSLLTKYL